MKCLSLYNQYVIKDNKTYVYNVQYSNCISFDTSDIEAVKNHLIKTDDSKIADLGYVEDQDLSAKDSRYWYNALKFSRDELNIMLVLTYNCNCACKYCFENLATDFKKGGGNLGKTVDFIIDHYNKNRFNLLNIHFFGGEPLLEVDKIIETAGLLKNAGVNFRPNIITNGVLLSERVVCNLTNAGIRHYQITLDGPKEIHDMRRPCKDGSSSWDAIQKNIKLLLEKDVGVSIRINIDKENVGYLSEVCALLPKEFHESNNSGIYIAPIVGCLKDNFFNTIKERSEYLLEAWKSIADKNLPITISPPVYAPCPYHSHDSAFYIDLFGNIYFCGGFVGEVSGIDQIYNRKLPSFYERINYMPKDSCLRCSFFHICMGGCQFEAKTLGANCQYSYFKKVYDAYFTTYAKNITG